MVCNHTPEEKGDLNFQLHVPSAPFLAVLDSFRLFASNKTRNVMMFYSYPARIPFLRLPLNCYRVSPCAVSPYTHSSTHGYLLTSYLWNFSAPNPEFLSCLLWRRSHGGSLVHDWAPCQTPANRNESCLFHTCSQCTWLYL